MANFNSFLHTFLSSKFFASCGMEHCAASVNDIANGAYLHRDERALHKALIATVNTVNLNVILTCCTNYCTNGSVHSRGVSAACQNSDCLHYNFLLRIH